ncbi:MAG: hypothetical protein HYX36_04725 [Rhizobiales bacterium]|nr:hypothetical protein [Hyphomicrobiales bacterium]
MVDLSPLPRQCRRHDGPAAVTMPRQIGMYVAKKMTSRSLPEIGRRFGGRDHSTVLHAAQDRGADQDRRPDRPRP